MICESITRISLCITILLISCTLLKVTKEADLVETHILAALGIRFSRNILSSVQAETCISNSGKFVNIHLWRVKNADSYETQEIQSSLCSVNTAFSALRTLIPTEPADRKLSKIETLRLASSYISHLGAVLVAGPIDQPCLHADGNGDVYGMSRWADLQARPQVCTFCLAMHKKYALSIPSEVISDCQRSERTPYVIPTTSATYFDLSHV